MKKILFFICLFFVSRQLQAQEFKTNESIGSQLINGTVPNAVYGKKTPAPPANAKKENDRSNISADAIKNNKMPGWKYSTGAAAGSARTSGNTESKKEKLPSDTPVTKPETKSAAEHKIPSQETKKS